MDIFWKWEEAKNKQQSFNVNRGSSLLQLPQLQQQSYTELLRNSSFTNAANQVLQSTPALFHCHGTYPSFINYSEYSSLNSLAWLEE